MKLINLYLFRLKMLRGAWKTLKNPTTLLLSKANLKKSDYILKLKNKLQFFIRKNSNDSGILLEFFLHDPYKIVKSDIIKNSDVIVDIGANIGVFSVFASKKAKMVYAIEPMPDNYLSLKKNIELNTISNCKLFEAAISKSDGFASLEISEDTAFHTLVGLNPNQSTKKKIDVVTFSLDSFIEKNKISKIDILKLDCEGSEYEILFNTSENTFKIIDRIVMECHPIPNYGQKDLEELFKRMGYQTLAHGKDMLVAYKK